MYNTAVVPYRPERIQARHWVAAAHRLADLETLANAQAWKSLEQYMNVALRDRLQHAVQRLELRGEQLLQQLDSESPAEIHKRVDRYRGQYLKVEAMLDFFADAIVTRTNPEMVALLRACDKMAESAMHALLQPLGYPTPPVLCYIDKGLGASILKAGLRLWDNHTENPVAAIKVVRHNLLRPTALVHEAGHQVAHITGWNDQLQQALYQRLERYGADVAGAWASWASEIAADAFAFVHTGFASVAALHDVVDGPPGAVFRFHRGDPHPISYLRVLTGVECCKTAFGDGPWENLRADWMERFPLHTASPELQPLLETSVRILPEIADIILNNPCDAFQRRPVTAWIDPAQVDPARLQQQVAAHGKGFFNSGPLIAGAPLQQLAWNGYQIATSPDQIGELLQQQREWMLRLGHSTYSTTQQ